MSRESGVGSLESGVGSRESGVWSRESGIWSRGSGEFGVVLFRVTSREFVDRVALVTVETKAIHEFT